MILDTLNNTELYYGCHPLFEKAFEFLRSVGSGHDLNAKTEIDGTDLFVLKVSGPGKDKEQAALETHRKYIDIQYSAAGCDMIGWQPNPDSDKSRGYDMEKDVEFYDIRPDQWIALPPGTFAVFFPGDGHAPMATPEFVTKLVVKVRVLR